MGIYSKYVLPHIIDLAMRNSESTRLRSQSIPKAWGEVLEVGIGSGLNLPFYSHAVKRVYGIDPSLELQNMARKRVANTELAVDFLQQSAEEPFRLADRSIDSVVVTWSLCSMVNPAMGLSEMRRVLKSSGCLIFVEHGRAQESGIAVWQRRITPLWKHLTGGCHLDRPVAELITRAGFQISELKTFYTAGPRVMSFTYQGFAKPA
jgi:ubiquinone/menaquinone biosynthesis C-methylase UbiE